MTYWKIGQMDEIYVPKGNTCAGLTMIQRWNSKANPKLEISVLRDPDLRQFK